MLCVRVCAQREVFLDTSASIFNLKIYIWDLVLKGFASSDERNWFGIEYDRQEKGKWTILVQIMQNKGFLLLSGISKVHFHVSMILE